MNNLKFSRFLFLIIMGLVFSFGCKDDNVGDPIESPPELPPMTSMQMDFTSFTSFSGLSKQSNGDLISSMNNWGWASLNGTVWQTIVTAGLIIPVAAFAESFNHDPVKQSDGKWLWQYNFTSASNIKHTASLYADNHISGVNWEMYISKENLYDDFLWFKGESDLLATEGSWELNFEPSNPTAWLGIEWHRNIEDSTADIKYTNIVPSGLDNGAYIFYVITADETYDIFYDIYNKGKENMINIKWNRETHIGRVSDLLHFGDSDWHCWDENLQDVDCQ